MKAEYEISISNSSAFKNEAITQVIDNLDKLETISTEVYFNIGEALQERKKRIELISSRISRISQIIGILENVPEAITLLSKKFYPDNVESYIHKSIYYNDICDFSLINQVSKHKEKKKVINAKPANSLEDLGKAPDTTIDDIKLAQEIVNSVKSVANIKTNFTLNNSYNPVEEQPIPQELEMLTSVFGFTTKIKAFGNQLLNKMDNLNRDSNLLNQFMRQTKGSFSKKPKQQIRKPSQAPTTLMSNNTKSKVDPKKDVLRVKTKITNDNIIDSKIKQNINMPNVVNIDIGGGNSGFGGFNNFGIEEENYDDTSQIIPEGQIIPDDINDFELPIDKVYKININRQPHTGNQPTANLEKNVSNDNSNYNHQSQTTTNQNINANPNPQVQSVSNDNVIKNSQSENANQAKVVQVSSGTVQNVPQVNNVQQNIVPNIPVIPTITTIPTIKIPTIPGVPQVKVVISGGPNIPTAPKISIPIPKIKPKPEVIAKPKVEAKENPEGKDNEEKIEEEKAPPKKDAVRA